MAIKLLKVNTNNMLEKKYYNIGNVIKISVRANSKVCAQIDSELEVYRCEPFSVVPEILIDCYSFRPNFKPSKTVDEYTYGEGFLHRPELKMQIKMTDQRQMYYMDCLIIPIDLIIQIALINQKHTLIHAAGININGKNILMPGMPGIGKTRIVTSMMKSGARLFGDDFCIVGCDNLHPYPKYITFDTDEIGVANINAFKYKIIRSKDKFLDSIIKILPFKSSKIFKITRYFLRYLKTSTVKVPPLKIFGNEFLAKTGKVTEVIFLERSNDISKIEKRSISINELSSLCAGILWHEWHPYFHYILLYDALSSNGNWFKFMYEKVEEILGKEFSKSSICKLKIPVYYDINKLNKEILKMVKEGEI